MSQDPVLAHVLDLVLRERHDPRHQVVVVSSPPGGGKTSLIEVVAIAASRLGLQVAIACPRAEQAFALTRRLRDAAPSQPVRLVVGSDRPLPADLQAEVIPLGQGRYDLGPPAGPPLVVGTVAKLGYLATSDRISCDLLMCDEAFQIALADLVPLLSCSPRFLLVGDPGQLPPLVLIDAAAFAAARFRVHEPAAQELLRHRPATPHLRLPATYRLPPDTIPYLLPLYPGFPFRAVRTSGQCRLTFTRPGRVRDALDRVLDLLGNGVSLVCLELPRGQRGGVQLDQEAAALIADVAERMLSRGLTSGQGKRFTAGDIGVIDPHVASGAAIRQELVTRHVGAEIHVATPEVWQGQERPLTIVHHPLNGAEPGSAFALDPGRSCVALSRHQHACVVVTRAGVEDVLEEAMLDPGTRPLGAPDRLWQGLQVQRGFWQELRRQGRIVPV